MWYHVAKGCLVFSVNVLNVLLAGNLPPFVAAYVIV